VPDEGNLANVHANMSIKTLLLKQVAKETDAK